LFIAYQDALKREQVQIPESSLATILRNKQQTKEISQSTIVDSKYLEFSTIENFNTTWDDQDNEQIDWSSVPFEKALELLQPTEATRFAMQLVQGKQTKKLVQVLQTGHVRQNEYILEYVLLQNSSQLLFEFLQVPDLIENQIVLMLRFVLLRLPESDDLEFVLEKLMPKILNYQNVSEIMLLRETSAMTKAEVGALLKYLAGNQSRINTANFAMWLKLILDGHLKTLLSFPSAMESLQEIRKSMTLRIDGYNHLATLLGQTKLLSENKKLPQQKDKTGLQYQITIFK
jgi:hypothetical protein